MSVAKIQLNGVDGSNDNLPLNTLVQLNNHGDGNESTFLWAIAQQPVGGTDTLSATNIQNPTLTPKNEGSYLITLVVDQGLATECQDSAIVGILQLKTQTRIPAATETKQVDAARGWAPRVDVALQRLDSLVADPGTLIAVSTAIANPGQVFYLGDLTTIKTGLPGQEYVPFAYPVASASDLANPLVIFEGKVGVNGACAVGDLIVLRSAGIFRAATFASQVGYVPAYCSTAGVVSAAQTANCRMVGTFQGGTNIVASFLAWGAFYESSDAPLAAIPQGCIIGVAASGMAAGIAVTLGNLTSSGGLTNIPIAEVPFNNLEQPLYLCEGKLANIGSAAAMGELVLLRYAGVSLFTFAAAGTIAGVFCDGTGNLSQVPSDPSRCVGTLIPYTGANRVIWGAACNWSPTYLTFGCGASSNGNTVKWLWPTSCGVDATAAPVEIKLPRKLGIKSMVVNMQTGVTGTGSQYFKLYINGSLSSLVVAVPSGSASGALYTTPVETTDPLFSLSENCVAGNPGSSGGSNIAVTLELYSA